MSETKKKTKKKFTTEEKINNINRQISANESKIKKLIFINSKLNKQLLLLQTPKAEKVVDKILQSNTDKGKFHNELGSFVGSNVFDLKY